MNTFDPAYYLRERYLGDSPRRSPLVGAYYALKPLLPPPLRLAMRRVYARRQATQTFPSWPVESILVDRQHADFRRLIHAADGQPVPFLHFWPGGAQSAVILTHDVEGPAGIANIPLVREIERRHGFTSAWYFVGDDYPIPPRLFERLRADGCEVGLHGIHHDAKLFASRAGFEANLPTIHRYLADWDAVGFRSPATHRNADWMPELGCLYDTSFSDTAPFEPQPGGCCSIHPYFLDDLVELPMTLVMDHTLWEILRDTSSTQWVQKARWLIDNHGLVNLLVHPDYVTTPARTACYDEFLTFLAAQERCWHTLPRTVAGWWKGRGMLDADAPIDGPIKIDGVHLQPVLAHAREVNDEIILDLPDGSPRISDSR